MIICACQVRLQQSESSPSKLTNSGSFSCAAVCSYVRGHGHRWLCGDCEHWHFFCCDWDDEKEIFQHSAAAMYPWFFLSFSLLFEDAIYLRLIPLWPADLRMDVRDMSMFPDESFDCAIDKGMHSSVMLYFWQLQTFSCNFTCLTLLFS